MSAGRLVVLVGLAGAGKTTVATQIEHERGALRLCTDEWMAALGFNLWDPDARTRVDALQQDLAVGLAARGALVVYESGGWTRQERDELRSRTLAAGAEFELRFLDVALDVLRERITQRNAEADALVVIPTEVLDYWWRAFEPPMPDELGVHEP